MTVIVVDVEANGPIPGDYSMIALGACTLDQSKTFLVYMAPLPDSKCNPEALAISGFSEEDTMKFPAPEVGMKMFRTWLDQFDHPLVLFADNNGFDWGFVNWYFWHFLNENPFGFSSRNINDIFHGLEGNMRSSFKKLRRTKHDHNPLNDAIGNAEALETMVRDYGLKGMWK